MGFACKIGKTTSFLAELHDRLNLCLNHNFAAVEVELDAKAIVDAISNLNYTNLFVSPLIDDCKLWVSESLRFALGIVIAKPIGALMPLLIWEDFKPLILLFL